MTIDLSKESQKKLVSSIRKYFKVYLDDDIGDLKAELLLDYILKEICPSVYNKAIQDAQAFFQDQVADLEGTCYEPETSFWTKEPDAPDTRGPSVKPEHGKGCTG